VAKNDSIKVILSIVVVEDYKMSKLLFLYGDFMEEISMIKAPTYEQSGK
jgi:hypothetical protein